MSATHSNGADPAHDLSVEQKRYLEGFASGLGVRRAQAGLPTFAATLGVAGIPQAAAPNGTAPAMKPEDIHTAAQDRFLAQGRTLTPEEVAKRKKQPLDLWDELRQHAEAGRFPKGTDVFLFKFHGLFYVAPAQDAFMCRLRMPNGILSSHQMRALADAAERFGGGYTDVTTRANLQIREIQAKDLVEVLTAVQEAGLHTRGAGADNIRNITGTPTAGIDPQEIIDTRPLARELHHFILNHREMYGLPRKFNVAFDGGGTISALEDTNDIGFAAVRVAASKGAPPGVYFRVQLGGITGHKDFARDTGLLLEPRECVPVAAAMLRVFIAHGDRTDRKKARLKYLLDAWGFEKFLNETQKGLPFPLRRLPLAECEPRRPVVEHAHVGFHRQRQENLVYAGVVLPVGRIRAAQMRALAGLAERHGSGTLRLTVWQNLLVSDIPDDRVAAVQRELAEMGLGWSATSVRGGLVACTGSRGCKFSATDTKGDALALAERLERSITLDQPINIHFTGCPHSCAQHYIGDIGLLGAKVPVGDDLVDGYHVFVGGGYGAEQEIGREIFRDVPQTDLEPLVRSMLQGFLDRRSAGESFREFIRRHPTAELQRLLGPHSPLAAPLSPALSRDRH